MTRRVIQHLEPLQIRADAGKAPVIVGYGAVFYAANDPGTEYRTVYSDGWQVIERIAAGAFDAALARADDIVALWGHDMTRPLGRRSRGTLALSVDARGLRYELTPPGTTWGADAVASIQRGDVEGSSFGFAMGAGWTETMDREAKTLTRTITKIDRLYEVSPVAIPAYPATAAGLRSADDEAHIRALIAAQAKNNTLIQTEKARAKVACALASLDGKGTP